MLRLKYLIPEGPALHEQMKWIEEHFPNAEVNQGWFVDDVDKTITSKIYGHGFVTTSYDEPTEHHFEIW